MAMFKSFLYGGDAPGDDSGDHPVMPLGGCCPKRQIARVLCREICKSYEYQLL